MYIAFEMLLRYLVAPVSHQILSDSYSLGKELGRYIDPPLSKLTHFTSLLCRGRFSKVHKAKHKATGGLHAVKLVRPEVRREAFEHELCVIFRLNHPNIIHCLGGVVNSNERTLIFEL